MPADYRVYMTPPALVDLESIHAYIAQESHTAAAELADRLLTAAESLNLFPQRYGVPRVGGPRGTKIRSMPVRPYLVRYRIDDTKMIVYVLRIRHGARQSP